MACDTVTQLVARLSSHIAAREEQRRDEARSKEQGAGRFVGFYVRGGAGYRRMESAAFFWGGGGGGGGAAARRRRCSRSSITAAFPYRGPSFSMHASL